MNILKTALLALLLPAVQGMAQGHPGIQQKSTTGCVFWGVSTTGEWICLDGATASTLDTDEQCRSTCDHGCFQSATQSTTNACWYKGTLQFGNQVSCLDSTGEHSHPKPSRTKLDAEYPEESTNPWM